MVWTLAHKKAVVTGGTKGIGRAIAEEFLKLGAEVFIIARTQADIDDFVAQYPKKLSGITADLANSQEITKICETVQQQWNGLDILINNVGTNIRKPTTDFTPEEYQKIFDSNLHSVWDMSRFMYPLLKKNQGCIVNISSIASLFCIRTGAPYAMTKAAMDHLTRYLSVEWGVDGIRVNSVLPGYTRTPLAQPVLDNPEKLQNILQKTPLQRIAEPQEVARVATFLCMPAASYVTGVCIPVDGGFSEFAL